MKFVVYVILIKAKEPYHLATLKLGSFDKSSYQVIRRFLFHSDREHRFREWLKSLVEDSIITFEDAIQVSTDVGQKLGGRRYSRTT